MLLQECELSQAEANSCGAIEVGGTEETERLSLHSITKNLTHLLPPKDYK